MKSLLICLVCALLVTSRADAATIFESGTLGPTEVTFSQLSNGTVPGTNVNAFVYTGVRFELTQPAVISQVGGHFVEHSAGDFFGAIVKLDDTNDFPNSGNLSTPDVLGITKLTFPNPSAEIFGDLSVSLSPGWYALVFGTGLFGTSGSGAAVRDGTDIGVPTYIGYQPGSGVGWIDITADGPNYRFVVNGTLVPEPDSTSVVSIAFAMLALTALRGAIK